MFTILINKVVFSEFETQLLEFQLKMWTTADVVERRHREIFDKTRLTRENIEHAMKQLFGFNKVLNENLVELMNELARREAVLGQFQNFQNDAKSVSIDDARDLLLAQRGTLYSDTWWDMFLTKRKIPHLPLTISEIALDLCDRLFPIHLDDGFLGFKNL